MESRNRKFSSIIPILIFLISSNLAFFQAQGINGRENLEINLGGGAYPPDTYSPPYPENFPPPQPPAYCPDPAPPPPPPAECPPPPSPPPPPPPSPPPPPPPPPPKPKPTPKPPPPSDLQSPELERAKKVIQKFRKTIKHDPMNVAATWKGKICDKSNYKGFICDTTISDKKQRVALVKFNGFDLGNSTYPLDLKGFLDGLTDLIVFHINTNSYAGAVPDTKRLPYLYELDLSNNRLTGAFPRTVLTATNLTFLDLRFNFLTGEVPAEAFRLDLDVLFLNNNRFSGHIPYNLGQTPSLYVTLANNEFSGAIPNSIGQASPTLREILLLNNRLSGCLPYQIGMLKSATLFDASQNHLTGPIPHSFGCLRNLHYLNISHNRLYGTVPESLCALGDLVTITLNHNFITEVGPKCRNLIASKMLDVGMNCIRDLPSQKDPAECGRFFSRAESCPDPESMNKVPCKIQYSDSEKKTTRKLLSMPRTYAALQERS